MSCGTDFVELSYAEVNSVYLGHVKLIYVELINVESKFNVPSIRFGEVMRQSLKIWLGPINTY